MKTMNYQIYLDIVRVPHLQNDFRILLKSASKSPQTSRCLGGRGAGDVRVGFAAWDWFTECKISDVESAIEGTTSYANNVLRASASLNVILYVQRRCDF